VLVPPDISSELIASRVREAWGVPVASLAFLPLGADAVTAAWRLRAADGSDWFLKLRFGAFDSLSVALPRLFADRGLVHAIAPERTLAGGLHAAVGDATAVLVAWVEGRSGFAAALGEAQWVELGAFLRRVHDMTMPPDIRQAVRREAWSPAAREAVAALLAAGAARGDRVAADLAALLAARRRDIGLVVARSGELAAALRRRDPARVLCHTDVHAGNVLVAADGRFFVVDWDDPLMAPRERDLMFFGAGVGEVWRDPAEVELFYRGYGEVPLDKTALAYYRYERIVQDVDAFARLVLDPGRARGTDDRERGVRLLASQFEPGGVVEIAHATYASL
jgi:spectinomycin phosphotransferase